MSDGFIPSVRDRYFNPMLISNPDTNEFHTLLLSNFGIGACLHRTSACFFVMLQTPSILISISTCRFFPQMTRIQMERLRAR